MKYLMMVVTSLTLVLTGCTSLKADKADVEVKSSKDVMITNVHIDREGREVTVHGSLRPKSATVTGVGHVDVEFISKDEGVLQTVKAETNTQQFSRQSSRPPAFSATVEIEGFDAVRLIHHPDTMKQCEL